MASRRTVPAPRSRGVPDTRRVVGGPRDNPVAANDGREPSDACAPSSFAWHVVTRETLGGRARVTFNDQDEAAARAAFAAEVARVAGQPFSRVELRDRVGCCHASSLVVALGGTRIAVGRKG